MRAALRERPVLASLALCGRYENGFPKPHIVAYVFSVRLITRPVHSIRLIAHLSHAAGFDTNDPIESRLDKLEALLREGTKDVASAAPLIAELLSLPAAERYGSLQLTPEQRKERTLSALIEQVLGVAAHEPVLMVLEDAHWIDPTTRELIGQTIEQIAGHPVMLMVTHRPEFESEWSRHPNTTVLTVNRLSKGEGASFVRAVPGGESLPDAVVADIVGHTDGVPLYIEGISTAPSRRPGRARVQLRSRRHSRALCSPDLTGSAWTRKRSRRLRLRSGVSLTEACSA